METVKILITPDLPDVCKIGLRTMLLNVDMQYKVDMQMASL